jgi:hypothetical protein
LSNDAAVTETGGFTRPEPPYEAEAGHHWEAVRADPKWGTAEPGKRCRYRGAAEHACGEPAAVVLTRGIRRGIAWNYCADDAREHYQVWAEDGEVMTWHLKED